MTLPSTPSRNLGLDLLRLVAILLVLGSHLRALPGGHGVLLAAWMRGGWVGVDVFFVLSGFLVSGLLFRDHQRHGRVSLGSFLIRRGLKIYPAFWVLIAFTVAELWHRGLAAAPRDLWSELFFVQNYVGHLWPHTWSLAIEEHFYLGLALLVWLLLRRSVANPFSWIPGIFVVAALACLGLRILAVWQHREFNFAWSYFATHLRIDSLFFGVLLAYLTHYHRLQARLGWLPPWARIAGGLALLLPAFIFGRDTDRWVTVIGFNLFYLGAGLLVLGAVRLEQSASRVARCLGALGGASYSIYLWHVPVNYLFAARIFGDELSNPATYWRYAATCVLGALAFGYVMARAVELPILHLRDRLCPPRGDPVTPLLEPAVAATVP